MPKSLSRIIAGTRRAPLEVGELARRDEVDLRLERAVEAVLPAAQRREDGDVLCLERVGPGPEDVGELAFVHEGRHLALAHDELRAVLDLVLVALEAIGERLVGVVEPLDDVDELLLQLVPQGHGHPPVWYASDD
jgi:hypothetical protein